MLLANRNPFLSFFITSINPFRQLLEIIGVLLKAASNKTKPGSSHKELNIKHLGIIISDTFGRPWRVGQTNISIGSYGINPLIDYQNNTDAFGKKLHTTEICIVDELSGGAEILMKKALQIPIVLIRGVKFQFSNKGSKEILRDKNLDLFR